MDGPFQGPIGRDAIVARIKSHPLGDDATSQRKAFEELVLGSQTAKALRDTAAESIRMHGRGNGTIVYLHGGGYAFGSPRTHERIARGLAERTGLSTLLPAYPLAPEHPWPAQLDAVLQAVQSMRKTIVLAGDSAGAHLALVTALELARLGMPVAGLVLFSPNTDRSGLSTTRTTNDPLDPMVDDAADRDLAKRAFQDLPAEHPHASPVLDDLTLLPPTYLEVGVEEVLLGDSVLLAERARSAGINVTLHVEPDGLHMGQLWAPWWPVAAASLDRAAAFVRSVIPGG